MTVLALEHVNIRTPDPERTISFFRDVLLMKVAPPPGQSKGAWVYAGDAPVVHIGAAESAYPTDERMPFSPSRGSGAVHHVALNCSDFDGVKGRLQALDLEFFERTSTLSPVRQIFVSEPNGVLFELNFRDQQA